MSKLLDETGPVVDYDVVVVIHHDGQRVAQYQTGPHHHVSHLTSKIFLNFPGENDQRNLSEHSQKSPRLKDKQVFKNLFYKKRISENLKYLQWHAQQILVQGG